LAFGVCLQTELAALGHCHKVRDLLDVLERIDWFLLFSIFPSVRLFVGSNPNCTISLMDRTPLRQLVANRKSVP